MSVNALPEANHASDAAQQDYAIYYTLVQNLPNMSVFVFDKDFRYLVAEGWFSSVLGLSKADYIGKTLWKVLPPAMAASLAPYYQAALDGKTVEFEGEVENIVYRTQVTPIKDTNGQIIAGLFISQDITEGRRTQSALQEAEERYRSLVDNSLNAILLMDAGGNILMANPEAHRLFGHTGEALIQSSVFNLLDMTDPVTEAAYRTLRQTHLFRGEICLKRRDSSLFFAEISAKIYPGSDRVSLSIRDITLRKQAEAALQESEIRFRQIAEYMGQVAYLFDVASKRIIFVNPAYETVLGLSRESLYTDPLSYLNVIHPEDQARIREFAYRPMTNDVDSEFRVIKPDGTIRWIQLRISPILDANGVLYRIVGTAEDITANKQYRVALAESEAQLQYVTENAPFMIYIVDIIHNEVVYVNQYTAEFFNVTVDELKLGNNPITPDKIHPDDLAMVENYRRSRLYRANAEQNQGFECRIMNSQGEWRWMLAQTRVLSRNAEGKPERLTTVVLDITDRKHREEREHEHRRLLQVQYDMATLMHTTLNLDEVYDRFVEIVSQVIPNDLLNIFVIDNDLGHIVCQQGYPESLKDALALQMYTVDSLPGIRDMQRNRQLLVIADIAPDEHYFIEAIDGMHSYLGAPIVAGGELLGIISLGSRAVDFFTAAHAEYLQAFVNQAAGAIQNAKLHQESQRLAASKERERLARELHDSVTQTLFSASMIAQSLPHLWKNGETEVRQVIADLARLTQGALAEMRTLLVELHPEAVEAGDLGELLKYLLNTLAAQRPIATKLELIGHQQLKPEVQVAFYRIAQAALNNILNHSQAEETIVRLQRGSDRAELSITDDGQGFDINAISANHFGLSNMRQRARAIGAELTIYSGTNEGTQLTLTWMPDSISKQENRL